MKVRLNSNSPSLVDARKQIQEKIDLADDEVLRFQRQLDLLNGAFELDLDSGTFTILLQKRVPLRWAKPRDNSLEQAEHNRHVGNNCEG